jgi:hypothetical protein
LHTRQFCPFDVLKLLDASNQRVCGCLFFGCSFCIPRLAPLNYFGSVKRSKTVLLGIQRFILDIKPFPAPALDGVGKLHIKILDLWPDADANTTNIVDGVLRIVAAEVKMCFHMPQ